MPSGIYKRTKAPWNKGKTMSAEAIEKNRQARLKEWREGRGNGFKKGNQWGKLTAGANHGQWNGGYKMGPRKNGKSMARSIKRNGKWVFEHRAVMEDFLGRPLKRSEIVHHIDGNALNNDIKNLQIVSQAEHSRLHRLGWRKNKHYLMKEVYIYGKENL